MTDKPKIVHIAVRVDEETADRLRPIVEATGINPVDLCRALLTGMIEAWERDGALTVPFHLCGRDDCPHRGGGAE